jgi:superfamily II DNA or RNA helicase
MKPLDVSKHIESRILRHIRKSLPVERSIPRMQSVLDEFFRETHPLSRDPYLESVPAYRPGESLKELADSGVIHQRTAKVFAQYFADDRDADPAQIKLHSHQAVAVKAVCAEEKNLVVCSGTGSGKTESFLIPLIDSLIREHESGTLNPGVRAMILYPMNALVNDQIRRLRSILRWETEITFGKFTGETAHDEDVKAGKADDLENAFDDFATGMHDSYSALGFDDEGRITNEVATREKWRDSAAHILVTNYSMLERLLLQPHTSNLFGASWKFIVLDEAHCYSGALGTEIAWLVRRVKRRVEDRGTPAGQLRFLATSATLISDTNLTNDQKAERIRTRFASQLFPAPADSFAVCFGDLEDVVSTGNGNDRRASDYVAIRDTLLAENKETSLLAASQNYLGQKAWRNRLSDSVGAILKDADGSVAIGDLLFVLSEVDAASKLKEDSLELEHPATIHNGILNPECQTLIDRLKRVFVAGIGAFNNRTKWRTWLHDSSNPAPSSNPDDLVGPPENRLPNPVGNQLHRLKEWEQPVTEWSRESLGSFFDVATRLAEGVETDTEPNALRVKMSDACRSSLLAIENQLVSRAEASAAFAKTIDDRWAQVLCVKSTGDFQNTLAEALVSDQRIAALRGHLGSIQAASEAEDATFRRAAIATFGKNDADRDDGLDAVIALGTMAKQRGKRTPLIDVRFHHMVRGVDGPGLYLSPEGETTQVTLTPDPTEDTLRLGLCRDCGQPYALGYAEGSDLMLGAPEVRVYSSRSHDHSYLHAFAWERGSADIGANNLNGEWLNTTLGKFYRGQQLPDADPNWVSIVARANPTGNTYPEFISMCPICGEEQTVHATTSVTRYGIITPYEAPGSTLRLTAMEELARLSDPSGDPSARTLPGEGRKLLAFSDSRSGSAGIAWGFQEYLAETTLARLVADAAEETEQATYPSDEDVLRSNNIPEEQWNLYMENPPFMELQRQQWGQNQPDPNSFGAIVKKLRIKIEQNNLAGLLSVAEVDQNDNPIGELPLEEAARWRLLSVISKKGRYSLRKRRVIRVSAKRFRSCTGQTLGVPEIPQEQALEIMDSLLELLLNKAQMQLPNTYPKNSIQRYKKPVSLDAAEGTFRWASTRSISTTNRYLSQVIVEETEFWMTGLRNALNNQGGNQAIATLAQNIANLGDTELKELSLAICERGNTQARRAVFPLTLIHGVAQINIDAVAGTIRNHFAEMAGNWLNLLWPIFTQHEGGIASILIDSGEGRFQLNPDELMIYPCVSKEDENVPVWEEEDAYLASREIIPLRIEEHTAQLAKERGSNYQRAFADGHINLLSCSTTFEMGVDLGDLSCVFLNGMPPSVANYRQRAGRAGRRPGSSSYVLTFLGNRDHDRYFWERPGELLYAPMQEPKIYLENRIFRARHLRAEALSDFLSWLAEGDGSRMNDNTARKIEGNPPVEAVEPKERDWTKIGDLLLGISAGRRENEFHPIIGRFRPLAAELPTWEHYRSDSVQSYVKQIDGIGELDYEVASDLVWQILEQGAIVTTAPFDLNDSTNEWNYRLLGGPNWPHIQNGSVVPARIEDGRPDIKRTSLQNQAKHFLGFEGPGFGNLSPFQNHVLHESSITWLSRCRVLPKYGFPVDVINLIPDVNDPFGSNVKLERDLKIGLYEYAPGQVVTADKRRYRSHRVEVYSNGIFQEPSQGNLIVRMICPSCHEPDWQAAAGAICRYCSGNQSLAPVMLCYPDAFKASKSTAGSSLAAERGAALHVHTGAFRNPGSSPENIRLFTKESLSGTITYINQGPGHKGFASSNGDRYSLCHEVRTDIAGWMLHPSLFAEGSLLQHWGMNDPNVPRNRLASAMDSALQAILRAIAICKDIEERDVQGIIQPGQGQNGDLGFVLFDDSTGGAGAVLDLILSGDPAIDRERSSMIRSVLQTAIELCQNCKSCDTAFDPDLMPLTKDELVGNQGNYRRAVSCYSCLRSHRNQAKHALLDRHDADALIRELLTEYVLPDEVMDRNAVSTKPPKNDFNFLCEDGTFRKVSLCENTPSPRDWVVVRFPNGHCAYGEWYRPERRIEDVVTKQLKLLKGVGLTESMALTDEQIKQLTIWKHTP